MALFHNSAITGASGNQGGGAGGYQISRSLRFNSADSAYLSRTPASAGNRKTWTWAGWVKRSGLGRSTFFSAGSSLTASFGFEFNSSDRLWIYNYTSAFDWQIITTSVYRDPSAWYHILLSVDTTQGTSANRVRLYVNGTEVTTFATATYPGSSTDTYVNTATIHTLGCYQNQTLFANLYLADVHFIDGQALTPSSFGEFDDNGVWQPIAYAGSYGTNGFYLDFADNSTAAALGTDTSGNGNTWTVNNLSVTTGAGNDSLVDTPTSYGTDTGAGGEVRGNYCTWNPLSKGSLITLSNGNLEADATSYSNVLANFVITSGKWYWEYTPLEAAGANEFAGIAPPTIGSSQIVGYNFGIAMAWNIGSTYNNSTTGVNRTTGYTPNADVIGVAYDADNGRLWFSKNATWLASGAPATGTNPMFTGVTAPQVPVATPYTARIGVNFGQRPFAYTAPSGFKALCTANLPEPVVAKPNEVMDVKLYTGNGSTQTISGLNFSPDLVWFKSRSTGGAGYNNIVFDAVRGASKSLSTDITSVEYTGTDLTSFNSDGFTLAAPNQWYGVNTNATTFVAWTWDAGSSTVTNTAGSITSQVRANASAGFSVVTFTGNGTQNATVGHGLGVAPTLHIIKNRSSSSNWVALTTSINGSLDYAYLNSTAAFGNAAQNAPTSSVFSVWNDTDSNANGSNYVAYCWTPVAGYSSFGSYIGNGSADGPFVYTGFRPRWLMIKRADNSPGAWTIIDTSRDPYNVSQNRLRANDFAGEDGIYFRADLVSNGFKLRDNDQEWNLSERYIYAAFAESPFQYARAR